MFLETTGGDDRRIRKAASAEQKICEKKLRRRTMCVCVCVYIQ